ncbi:MAG: seryl-tRNA synthetase [Candidatus Saccharibacteria bacterium]|jgi:seryl-tRNA synthetase|nr:seryl-tRNA synthetase [Candidatus Saccharibacteria bacterium]
MIDIRDLRTNPDQYRQAAKQKGIGESSVDAALKLDEQRRELLVKVEEGRAALNVKGKPTPEELEKLQQTKTELAELEAKLAKIEAEFDDQVGRIPNLLAPGTPEGGEEDNREERRWGEHVKFEFEPKDHLAIAEANGWIDFESGAKVAGSKFYFLFGALVRLEVAVTQFVLDLLEQEGFVPVMVPNMVSTKVASGTGYLPRGEERQIYKIEGEDLNLIATSEMPLTGLHADEIMDAKNLPKVYVGYSPAYRMEAGAYGKYSKGLYRVHQFNKLEMYVFCLPEESAKWHEKLVKLEEDICQALELPYRVVRIAAGDMGGAAYEKYDVEYWSPLENTYRELMSCSNVTDYQARRLGIRYRDAEGKPKFVHTLNGTAAAFSRLPIALLENHQQADGSVHVPLVLQKYYGRDSL